MLHLIKYNLLVKLRNFNTTFWPLVFPLILGTFFFFAFGNLNDADFETVQVAMVQETSPNPLFSFYIEQVKKSNSDLLNIQEMDESAALTALKSKKISGIYYNEMTPSLTVNAHGIPESILQSVLESYNNNLHTIQNILKKHPSGILEGLSQMADTRDLVQELSLGGKTIDGNSQFFYALIAMACLYGCFIGFGAAITLQANLTALAARRCVTPTHKLKLILSEQITSFLLGYTDVIILLIYLRIILKLDFQGQIGKMLIISLFGSLIGVSVGLFVGSLGKLSEGIKVAVILAISMVCSFLAGLINSNMKDLVEKHVPIINRINPAALISDAFYCINVYNDTARYYRNLVTLAVMSAAFVMQETRTLRPTFQVKLYRTTRIYHTSRDYASIFADFFRRRVFYSTHTPSRNSSTVRPSRHFPVIWLSSAPIITSSCRRDWFMPRASSSSFVSAVPPFVVPG